MAEKTIYRIVFVNQNEIYELHAHYVGQSDVFGFIEVEDLIFGEKSDLVIDPTEERLEAEYAGVTRTHVPLHSVLRIDEVEKRGANKISPATVGSTSNVASFPAASLPKRTDK
ncbi:MAG: DUF1820 family protein [Gammaproteobacteria bacterium]|nr:DUF1820 family protein [Gammaproteobacteria bacterium]